MSIHAINPPDYQAAPPPPFVDPAYAQDCADALEQAFTWGDSAEGDPFWRSVCDRLNAIARGESLR